MGLYTISTTSANQGGAEVTFPAVNTQKTLLGVKAGAQFGLTLCGFTFDIDGIVADSDPVELAIQVCTFATNPPGTNSTAITEVVANGPQAATGIDGAYSWASTFEPTAMQGVIWRARCDSNKLVIDKDFPLLDQPECNLGQGFAVTAFIETGDTVPTATFKGELRVRRV